MTTITLTLPVQDGWNRLDPSRRELVTQLFGPRGKTLLTFLLASSTHPGAEPHIALVAWDDPFELAALLGWSQECVVAYLTVFQALALLEDYHDRDRGHPVRTHIPLTPYVPLTSLDAFDAIIVSGKRQSRQLARKIKISYLLHVGGLAQPSAEQTLLLQEGFSSLQTMLDHASVTRQDQQKLQTLILNLLSSYQLLHTTTASPQLSVAASAASDPAVLSHTPDGMVSSVISPSIQTARHEFVAFMRSALAAPDHLLQNSLSPAREASLPSPVSQIVCPQDITANAYSGVAQRIT